MQKARIALWMMRLAFAIVFIWNMQCALQFMFDPASYASAAGLPVEGNPVQVAASLAAVRGLGVAFAMWNATYPAFIARPERFRALGWVVLVQQVIGLVGELFVLGCIGDMSFAPARAIVRFAVFDAAGLVIMGATFAVWTALSRSEA